MHTEPAAAGWGNSFRRSGPAVAGMEILSLHHLPPIHVVIRGKGAQFIKAWCFDLSTA